MRPLFAVLITIALAGCDVLSPDAGTSDLTLSGSRSGTIQGSAVFGPGSRARGQTLTLGDDDSGRTVSVDFAGAPAVGTLAVGSGVAVRYSPGVLSEGYTGTAGTVTVTQASSSEIRGRLDVGASIFGGEPGLQITGTFRAVSR